MHGYETAIRCASLTGGEQRSHLRDFAVKIVAVPLFDVLSVIPPVTRPTLVLIEIQALKRDASKPK